MNHGLFISAKVIAKPPVLLERLSHARDVTVPKNSEASLEESAFLVIPAGILVR